MNATLGHIILSVSDFRISIGFYDRLLLPLGFQSGWMEETDSLGIKEYRSGESTLFIRCDKKREHRPFVRDVGLDHLAIRVVERIMVDDAFARLSDENVSEAKAPREFPEYSPVYYACYFRDPDGIPLEIAHY